MSESKDKDKPWGDPGYAPDIPSDVAEWGDRPPSGKPFSEMTAEEFARAEEGGKKLRKRMRHK
jgi:hypothetical protein